MKINNSRNLNTGLKMKEVNKAKKGSSKLSIDTVKDQVTLGESKDNLGIMERPLQSMKSSEESQAALLVGGALALTLLGGAVNSGIGMAARHFGGVPGAVVATAAMTAGGALIGPLMGGRVRGALTVGTSTAAGALIGPGHTFGALAAGEGIFIGSMMLGGKE